ncbi:hypothetical protein LOTGIDRAFT_160350 [Lottia gigantea]|uniref:Homeobox domain-containing protein n=1 Tax=Lottia gigantea TaxID=225164 RepID=V3ZWA0_LOTGI|nr:hypothetical protein LOTGIDRAFT_160350 [Lottia gigantea]ESO95803.1 hypothetical protein LOTGIDRAFT_160350 [Lottia gigantea]
MKTRALPTHRSNDYLDMKTEGVKKKRNRVHYSADQIRVFERLFVKNNFPDRETLESICEDMDISHKNAQVWFQNRRARSRRDPNDVSSPRKPPSQFDSDSNSPCSSPKPRTAPKLDLAQEKLVTFVKKPIGNSKWHEPIRSTFLSTQPELRSPERQMYQPNISHPYMFDYNSYQPINHDVPFYYQPIRTNDSLVPLPEPEYPISSILNETNSVTGNQYNNDYGHSCYSTSGELGYYGNSESVTYSCMIERE